MTLAIDRKTGKVCGQVVLNSPVLTCLRSPHTLVALLTRDGYCYVDAASVRLERVED